MTSCTSAKVAWRLDRIDGMDTLTTKKSRPTRKAAARMTASDFHRRGSGAGTALAVADVDLVLPVMQSRFPAQLEDSGYSTRNGCTGARSLADWKAGNVRRAPGRRVFRSDTGPRQSDPSWNGHADSGPNCVRSGRSCRGERAGVSVRRRTRSRA